MLTTFKIATVSAVLSAALVCGFSAEGARSTAIPSETPKAFQDRVPQDATGGQPIVVAYATTGVAAEKAAPTRSTAKGDLLKPAPATDCTAQTWPYIARDCLAAASGTPVRQVARTVDARTPTTEERSAPNVSVLVKGTALTVASR